MRLIEKYNLYVKLNGKGMFVKMGHFIDEQGNSLHQRLI